MSYYHRPFLCILVLDEHILILGIAVHLVEWINVSLLEIRDDLELFTGDFLRVDIHRVHQR